MNGIYLSWPGMKKNPWFSGAASFGDQNLAEGTYTGGALGGIAGLLAGVGALLIPGIGPIVAAGPIAATLTGVVGGGLAGGLIDWDP